LSKSVNELIAMAKDFIGAMKWDDELGHSPDVIAWNDFRKNEARQ
jgi:hypothetical protein